MQLRVSGKNMDIGAALKNRVEDRLDAALGKYFDGRYTGHVTISREGIGFMAECVIHLPTGIVLEASASNGDATASFEMAAEKLEKRLRRYKRRLRDHHGRATKTPASAMAYVISPPDEEAEEVDSPGDAPAVIAERQTKIPWLSVAEAAMALDLSDAPALVFRHSVSQRLNVVYRRVDGNIGWIDPAEEGASA